MTGARHLLDRRAVTTGAFTLLGACGLAHAQSTAASLFPTGALSANALASRFYVPPASLVTPPTRLATEHGPRRLADLTGKVRIVTLWAEWCARPASRRCATSPT